ncbi:transcriptional regulator%2C Acidobacterial%2C PadR-family [uncultured Clostridium sp.]|uniref:PadR family transcriptional regulator n=1 Tax=uncultured Clostridium sp. TaxID=59620 RepID=UPI000820378F|nr:PadR family transcriptional regulator [uncultured Clostridium sp.]SCJ97555.1 transcriptional regulator%2C Acidobacterial%2C PadR-family [uncultured Clostridium sp.]
MNTQFKKGIVELCVLSLISKKDMYGYEVVKEIATDMEVTENTIYPILRRLTKEGNFSTYTKVSDGSKERKYYRITDEGKVHYENMVKGWDEFVVSVNKVLSYEYKNIGDGE